MNSKLPLISVIVPIYNEKEEYLGKCIDSIINQTLRDIEIILIDDGSESECKDLCDKYKSMDSRIVVIHKDNGGLSSARNVGIEISRGKWLAFIDGDDWVEENYLEELYNKTLNEDIDIVICDTYINYANKQLKNKWYDKNGILNKEDIKQLQLQIISKGVCRYYPQYVPITVVWSRIYNKDFLRAKQIKYIENLGIGEDKIFNLYAFENANKIFYDNISLYHYRINNDSKTHKYDETIAQKYFDVILEVQKFIKSYKKDADYVKSRDIATVLTIVNYFINNYLFNKKNKKSFGQKKKEFKELINKEIFREALKKIDIKYLNIAQKLTIVAIKLNSLVLLKLIYIVKNDKYSKEFIKRLKLFEGVI